MPRLSSPVENIKDHYPVVIIGSGYGGAIAASRLARAGQSVCLLERGKEFQPGEYPSTEAEALGEMQTDLPLHHVGPKTGLYDFRVNEDMNVVVGCGLGGTSLINANVCIVPEPRVFEDPAWPQALRDDAATLVAEGFRLAQEMLKPVPYPKDFPALPKLEALEKSAESTEEKFYRLPIKVTFEDGINHVGVPQRACTLCGDCVSGCNYAAKNTLIMNYLPDAKNHGAEIYTRIGVRHLERRGGRWLVYYQFLEEGREKFDAPAMFVSADVVILAAGALGSTEILLRSRGAGLALSQALGQGFTGNGDVLGFSYNNDEQINGVGWGPHSPGDLKPVGPTITGVIDRRLQPRLEEGMIVEEGAVPGVLASLIPHTLALAAKVLGQDTDAGLADQIREKGRELDSLLRGAYHGAVNHTQTYLVMTHDDAGGRMRLKDDRLRIDWPDVGRQPIFSRINDFLKQATVPLGGTFIPNPLWSKLFNRELITVHPLGGCRMAESAAGGVVNHKGQVYSGTNASAVYENLYVWDGSIMPRSLGVNPLMTICALAERGVALLARDRGWTIDYQLPSAPTQPEVPVRMGLKFTEAMMGFFSTQVKDDFARGAQQGQEDASPLEFVLTIVTPDLEAMLTDPAHEARMVGTLSAPALSEAPLTVTAGVFSLFVQDPTQVRTRQMRYRMKLTTVDGQRYYFYGFKVIHDDQGFDVWADSTTLYVTVYQGDSQEAPVLGRGILRIHPEDLGRQLATIQVTHAESEAQRLAALARFGRFFAGSLFDVYGGIFARDRGSSP